MEQFKMNYGVGDKVRVIAQFYGHGLKIGDEVEITEPRDWNGDYFIGKWLVREDEIEPIN